MVFFVVYLSLCSNCYCTDYHHLTGCSVHLLCIFLTIFQSSLVFQSHGVTSRRLLGLSSYSTIVLSMTNISCGLFLCFVVYISTILNSINCFPLKNPIVETLKIPFIYIFDILILSKTFAARIFLAPILQSMIASHHTVVQSLQYVEPVAALQANK